MDKFYSPKIIAILFNQKSKDAESLALDIKKGRPNELVSVIYYSS